MKPCPTCPAIIPTRQTRCADCKKRQRQASRRRNPTPQRRPWTWHRTAQQFLAANPTCCYEGCNAPATEVDHGPPRQLLLACHVNYPDQPPYLHPLCSRHHGRITRTIDQPLLALYRAGADPYKLAEQSLLNRYRNPYPHHQTQA